ncbi:MAG: AraC family transcriptional regulator [Christensenellaceae bacterium]|nr:AraC family transcriptional regulator [Christensenellaceae bacterium]MDD7186730.1 AraC family transcriptional regulator [Clostridia bacterium]MDY2850552.1 AraC family transcriptional regulator [Christensenellaceae bacterium]
MFNTNIIFYFQRKDTSDFKVNLHTHKCYELVYYFSGKGHCRVANKECEYRTGSLVLIPPEQIHNDVHYTACSLCCIGFTLETGDFSDYYGSFQDTSGKINAYLSMIDTEFKEQKPDCMIAINNLMENILLEIKRSANRYPEKLVDYTDTIRRALNYIDEYFLTDVSKEQLAAISTYSYDRFRHIFKNVMGVSPKQYIINKRLEYSKSLLANTDESITEISYKCGFSSTSHFIQVFKQATDLTPIAYRKQLRSEHVFSSTQTTYEK